MYPAEKLEEHMRKIMMIRLLVVIVVALSIGTEAMAQKKIGTRGRSPAAAVGLQRSLTMGTTFLKKRDFANALAFADKAITQKPDDPRGYALAIQAYAGLGDFESALATGERARAACKPEALASIDELLSEVRADRSRHDRLRTAEKYAADGNAQMAASAYEEAWNGDPENEELGVKAASIYNDQVKDFDKAIALINKILLRTKDATISSQAKELLQVAEGNREAKREDDRRKAEVLAQKQAELRERERREAVEREKQQRQEQVREQIRELEAERERLENRIQSEESMAESNDGFADDNERRAASYDGQQFGAIAAALHRNEARKYKNKAAANRRTVRELQSEINSIARKISALERDLN
jgi:tetratricopeptide (TPR) repeat protein